jgi:hypothetical protein
MTGQELRACTPDVFSLFHYMANFMEEKLSDRRTATTAEFMFPTPFKILNFPSAAQ